MNATNRILSIPISVHANYHLSESNRCSFFMIDVGFEKRRRIKNKLFQDFENDGCFQKFIENKNGKKLKSSK